jgi:hypothetical protein
VKRLEIKTGTIWNKEQLDIIKGLAIEHDMQIKDVIYQLVQKSLDDLSEAELKKAKDNMKVNSFNRVIKEEKKLFKEDL